jgi:hypothetical protein
LFSLAIAAAALGACNSTVGPNTGAGGNLGVAGSGGAGVGGAEAGGGRTGSGGAIDFGRDGGRSGSEIGGSGGGGAGGVVGGLGCHGGATPVADAAAAGTPFDCGPEQCAVGQTYCMHFGPYVGADGGLQPDSYYCYPFPTTCEARDCSATVGGPPEGNGALTCSGCTQAPSGAVFTSCMAI